MTHVKLPPVLLFLLSASFIFLLQSGCERKEIHEVKKIKTIDSVVIKDTLLENTPELKITYHKYLSKGLKTLTDLRKEYGILKRRIILALNRIDHDNVSMGE